MKKKKLKLNSGKLAGHVSKPMLAKMLGISPEGLHYHLAAQNIEQGDVQIGKRFFYSRQKAAEILERVKGTNQD